MGVAALSIKPPDVSASRYYLEQAKSMMDAMKEATLDPHSTVQVSHVYCLAFGNDHLGINSMCRYLLHSIN